MCGIFGVRIKDNKDNRIVKNLYKIFKNQKERGQDGAGMVLLRDNKTKRARVTNPYILFSIDFWDFWSNLKKGDILLFHHRIPTAGDGGNNIKSNHPITNENKDLYLIHNGMLFNDFEIEKDLIKQGHIFETNTQKGITDSEIFVHLLEQGNIKTAFKKAIKNIRGSYSIAFIKEQEDNLYLFCDGSENTPLKTYKDRAGNFYFSSKSIKTDYNNKNMIKQKSLKGYCLYCINREGQKQIITQAKKSKHKNYYTGSGGHYYNGFNRVGTATRRIVTSTQNDYHQEHRIVIKKNKNQKQTALRFWTLNELREAARLYNLPLKEVTDIIEYHDLRDLNEFSSIMVYYCIDRSY